MARTLGTLAESAFIAIKPVVAWDDGQPKTGQAWLYTGADLEKPDAPTLRDRAKTEPDAALQTKLEAMALYQERRVPGSKRFSRQALADHVGKEKKEIDRWIEAFDYAGVSGLRSPETAKKMRRLGVPASALTANMMMWQLISQPLNELQDWLEEEVAARPDQAELLEEIRLRLQAALSVAVGEVRSPLDLDAPDRQKEVVGHLSIQPAFADYRGVITKTTQLMRIYRQPLSWVPPNDN